jgi:hypothetical protein
MRDLTVYIPDDLSRLDPNNAIAKYFPKVSDAIEECGGKVKTKFTEKHLTIMERPTLIGRARQIMQEVSQIKEAIRQNYFNLKIAEMDLETVKKELGPEHIVFQQKKSEYDSCQVFYRGAIKQVAHYSEMYQEILDELGVDQVTEQMIDDNQVKEHIMTMFMQSYRAFVEQGAVDEGDLVYSDQVRIDPSECDYEVRKFACGFLGKRKVKTPDQKTHWLEEMYKKYEHRCRNRSISG